MRKVAVAAVALVAVVAAVVVVLRPGEQPAPLPLAVEGGPPPMPGARVRVEVLNAGGVSGLAGDATDELRRRGFDVVSFRNAEGDFTEDSTRVVDRVGRLEMAEAVAEALGVPATSVRSLPDSTLYVDVSVLLGPEWHRAGALAASEAPRPWWDPRGWGR